MELDFVEMLALPSSPAVEPRRRASDKLRRNRCSSRRSFLRALSVRSFGASSHSRSGIGAYLRG